MTMKQTCEEVSYYVVSQVIVRGDTSPLCLGHTRYAVLSPRCCVFEHYFFSPDPPLRGGTFSFTSMILAHILTRWVIGTPEDIIIYYIVLISTALQFGVYHDEETLRTSDRNPKQFR